MLRATDSLIHFIEKNRSITMPKFKYVTINHYKIQNISDYDIAESMNLMFQLHDEPMCYLIIELLKSKHPINLKPW